MTDRDILRAELRAEREAMRREAAAEDRLIGRGTAHTPRDFDEFVKTTRVELVVGDVVRMPYSRHTLVITAVVPRRPSNPFDAVDASTGAKFKFGHAHAPEKVGHLDDLSEINALKDRKSAARKSAASEGGKARAYAEMIALPEGSPDRERWRILHTTDEGADILTSRGMLKFAFVLARGERFAFVARKGDGSTGMFKFPLAIVRVAP